MREHNETAFYKYIYPIDNLESKERYDYEIHRKYPYTWIMDV